MSIIRDVFIPLETIIAASNIIVEVEVIESFEENVAVSKAKPEEPVPDFIKKGWVFKVKRILKNTTDKTVPDKIYVPNENWRRFYSQHVARYGLGPNKSYNVNTYRTPVSAMKDAEILFLKNFQDTYELTTKDSFEYLKSFNVIEKLIAGKK